MNAHPESHLDHGFTKEQWDFIFTKYADKTAFFIDTFELPENLGTVTNELYGPSCGDEPVPESEVVYAKRGDRAWKTRFVLKLKRPTRFVRVIAGPHEEKCPTCNGTGLMDDCPFAWYGLGNEAATCVLCAGAKVIKHACILYTAYGVHSLDASQSPKEPGDIRKQLEEVERKRYGLNDLSEAHKALTAQVIELRVQRTESDVFWSMHALAAPLSMMPCPTCGTPNMGDAVYDPTVPDTDGRCQTCGML